MKYTVQSSKYILKNFWYILPFAVIPALLLSFSTDEQAMKTVLQYLYEGKLQEIAFSDIFRAISVLNFGSWKSVLFGLLAIVVIIFCVALMMALLEKHMRIGKRTFNGVFSKLNDNFISTCGYGILLVAIYEVWCLITAALLYLVSMIQTLILAYVMIGLFFIAMHVVLIYLIGLIYLWLPCMQITGFRPLEALHYSYHLIAPVKWLILLGQIVILFAMEVLIVLCVVLTPNEVAFTVLTTVLYTLLIMIYCVRMQIAYFDRDNIERADLRGYYR